MADTNNDAALSGYAHQVLAGTGLSITDVTGDSEPAEGSAAHALAHGWDMARRAAKVAR